MCVYHELRPIVLSSYMKSSYKILIGFALSRISDDETSWHNQRFLIILYSELHGPNFMGITSLFYIKMYDKYDSLICSWSLSN